MENEDALVEKDRIIDPAHALISSRRIEGTEVWNRTDGKLGTIHSLMIEKRRGKVAYALLSFGGFLGIGQRVHPVPWDMLRYDPAFDAYMVELGYDQLKSAPTLHLDKADRPQGRAYDEQVAGYYGRTPWWGL